MLLSALPPFLPNSLSVVHFRALELQAVGSAVKNLTAGMPSLIYETFSLKAAICALKKIRATRLGKVIYEALKFHVSMLKNATFFVKVAINTFSFRFHAICIQNEMFFQGLVSCIILTSISQGSHVTTDVCCMCSRLGYSPRIPFVKSCVQTGYTCSSSTPAYPVDDQVRGFLDGISDFCISDGR